MAPALLSILATTGRSERMFSRVLLPLDGSETAERVLPQLRRLLSPPGSEIVVFRALDADVPDVAAMAPAARADAERYVRKITFQLIQEGRRARSIVREGGGASAILEAARTEKADLIALTTHGRSGLSRLLLGSVAESVVRGSPAPVFLVRSFPPALGAPSRGRLESTPIHHVLVPLDGGEMSRRVVPFVQAVVRPLDARVTLLYVHETPGPHPRWLLPGGGLEAIEHDLRGSTIPVSTVVREGAPAGEILAACRSSGADLLVMATHARSGPARWILGSVTESVLRAAEIPLLVVPARAQAAEQAAAPRREVS
jgi:nucleotide-binding universal stress UspA family protein